MEYFTLWDPDHRIEVAPGQYRALFADLFDRAVTTTAYAISDSRTTPDLAARLMEASGTAVPAGPIPARVARPDPGPQVTPLGKRQTTVRSQIPETGERRPGTDRHERPGPGQRVRSDATSRRCPETRSSAVVTRSSSSGMRPQGSGVVPAGLRAPAGHSGCRRARYGRPRRPPRASAGRGRRVRRRFGQRGSALQSAMCTVKVRSWREMGMSGSSGMGRR